MKLGDRRTRTLLAAAAIACLALAARLSMIGSKSLWLDEAYAMELARMPAEEIVQLPSREIPHAPLHFLLMKLSTGIFGDSEAALRLPSALMSGLAVLPLMLLAARLAGRRAGLWAGLFWSLAPYAVSLGQEAWVYGTLAGLGMLFAALALEVWRGSRKLFAPLVVVGAAGFYTSLLFGPFALAGLGLWPAVPRESRCRAWVPATAALLLALLAVPVVMSSQEAMDRMGHRRELAGVPALDLSRAVSEAPVVVARLIPGGILKRPADPLLAGKKRLLLYALSIFVLAGAAALSAGRLRRSTLAWLAAVVVVSLAFGAVQPLGPRTLSVLWLPTGILLGAAAARFRWPGPGLALAMVPLLAIYYSFESFPYHRADWREAAKEVSQRYERGDRVILLNRQTANTIWRYYAPEIEARAVAPPDAVDELAKLSGRDARIWVVKDFWSSLPADEAVRRSGLVLSEAIPTDDLMQIVLALPPEHPED